MKNSSPLLINEHPLQVLPTLAVILGLNEAMILQQIHFWLCNKDKRCKPYINENESWVYNTYEDWHEQFPFWSVPTIKRAILDLENKGVLVSRQFDLSRGEAKKYYRINHKALTELLPAPSDQIDPIHQIKLIPPSDQIDPIMIGSKRSHLIGTENPETTTEREPSSADSELADTDNLFDTIKRVTGFDPVDFKGEQKLWQVAEQLRGGKITSADLTAYSSTRTKSAPKLQYLFEDVVQWKNTNGKTVSANSASTIAPLQIPPGLTPGESKRFIEAHVAQQRLT